MAGGKNPNLTTLTDTDKVFLVKDGDWIIRKPITMAENATGGPNSDGILPRGRAIGLVSATGKAKDYNDGGSGGVETCIGFLDEEVDVSAGDKPSIYVWGFAVIDESECSGIDANGKTDLAARGIIWA